MSIIGSFARMSNDQRDKNQELMLQLAQLGLIPGAAPASGAAPAGQQGGLMGLLKTLGGNLAGPAPTDMSNLQEAPWVTAQAGRARAEAEAGRQNERDIALGHNAAARYSADRDFDASIAGNKSREDIAGGQNSSAFSIAGLNAQTQKDIHAGQVTNENYWREAEFRMREAEKKGNDTQVVVDGDGVVHSYNKATGEWKNLQGHSISTKRLLENASRALATFQGVLNEDDNDPTDEDRAQVMALARSVATLAEMATRAAISQIDPSASGEVGEDPGE